MTSIFERQVVLPVRPEEAFAWHERPGALDRLIPPWENVRILRRGNGIFDGSVVELVNKLGPIPLKWTALHKGYEQGVEFRDSQVAGPFKRWEHLHQLRPYGEGKSLLVDHVDYELPGGALARTLAGSFVERKLETMFAYRHRTTFDDLEAHARFREQGKLRVAVTGSAGLIGSSLVPFLTTGGHEVVRLVRKDPGDSDVLWDPRGPLWNAAPLDGIDAVVHLAGENIAGSRWSPRVKERIYRSRVEGTRILCEGLSRMNAPPRTLVCASAIGIYGDRGDEVLTEQSSPGSGFLADVGRDWEQACEPAVRAGIRVVHARLGMVLSPRGGALQVMSLPFRLGLGGTIGNGSQYWSWVSIDDAVGAIHHALFTPTLVGPVNIVAPVPSSNAEFTRTFAEVLHRPAMLPVPRFMARIVLGEMADALLAASLRVHPERLLEADYRFRQPTLETALRHLLGRTLAEPRTAAPLSETALHSR